jgi:signal transduction histidine kinase
MAADAITGDVVSTSALIAAAADAERRRIQRDLHDGAQQRLLAVGLALQHLRRELEACHPRLAARIDEAAAEVSHAVADLRELVRGEPAALRTGGLRPALRELAQRCPVAVSVDAPLGRVGRELEAAAYFVAAEAMTNAVKHGGATHIVVRARVEDGTLAVSVGDDGCGGACEADGTGLAGLRRRVEDRGGRLRVTSPPGAGTTVAAELPCAGTLSGSTVARAVADPR